MTPEQQIAYDQMILEGVSPSLAEMFALQKAPGIQTDSTFFAGHCNGNQFEKTPQQGEYLKEVAAKAGVDVTGKVYMSSLAEFPSDPRAWVSTRGEIKQICEERGWSVSGGVNHKSSSYDEGPDPLEGVKVNPSLVDNKIRDDLESGTLAPDSISTDDKLGCLREEYSQKMAIETPLE